MEAVYGPELEPYIIVDLISKDRSANGTGNENTKIETWATPLINWLGWAVCVILEHLCTIGISLGTLQVRSDGIFYQYLREKKHLQLKLSGYLEKDR